MDVRSGDAGKDVVERAGREQALAPALEQVGPRGLDAPHGGIGKGAEATREQLDQETPQCLAATLFAAFLQAGAAAFFQTLVTAFYGPRRILDDAVQDQIGAMLCVEDTGDLARARYEDGAREVGDEAGSHERQQGQEELRPVAKERDQDLVVRRRHGAEWQKQAARHPAQCMVPVAYGGRCPMSPVFGQYPVCVSGIPDSTGQIVDYFRDRADAGARALGAARL